MTVTQILIFLLVLHFAHSESMGEYDTVIIGGGISGVKAAVDLANSGQRVIILQANNYLGGRMKSRDITLSAGQILKFDEGASWIHGNSEDHPITKLANDVEGLVTTFTDDQNVKVYDLDSNDVSDGYDASSGQFDDIVDQFEGLDPSVSVKQAITNFDDQALTIREFMLNVANDIEFQTSGTIDKISAYGYNDEKFTGNQRLILSGYQNFVETLAKKANFQVLLNHKVRKVLWSGSQNKNRIFCDNGVQIIGSFVVVAIPLGALKKENIVFKPELPSWKTEAINSIAFGNICKILIQFSTNDFITSEEHFLGVANDDVNKRGFTNYFLNLKQLAQIPALMTFGLGPNADEVQTMDEGNLKTIITSRLNIVLEPSVIQDSDYKLYRSSWKSKLNFGGAYSYASTSTRKIHWDNMAKPIPETQWYFCGEHTYQKYRGTVHGAYLSGEAVANQIKQAPPQPNLGLIIGLSVMGCVLLALGIFGGICLYKKCKQKNQNTGQMQEKQQNVDSQKDMK